MTSSSGSADSGQVLGALFGERFSQPHQQECLMPARPVAWLACYESAGEVPCGLPRGEHGFMANALRALIIAPDDVPGDFGDYVAACQALKLEPNEHRYVVCLVSTAAGPRTLLTVDLDLLQDTEKAGTPDQTSLLGTSPSKETVGTGAAGVEGNPFGDFCRRTDVGPPPSRLVGEPPDRPVVELVLDLDRATLKGVAVWNAADEKFRVATPLDAAVRETFADTVAEAVVGELWPAHAASPALADFDTALMAVKGGTGATDPPAKDDQRGGPCRRRTRRIGRRGAVGWTIRRRSLQAIPSPATRWNRRETS